jgi:CubicO group peptidase (beta-lactamase class C family)
MSVANVETEPGPNEVNLANWRHSPFSRWAFRNIRAVLPVADIAPSDDADWPLPVRAVSLAQFHLGGETGVTLRLDDVLRATATDGIVILHDGHVVFEAYDQGLTPRAPHIIMSATKSIVGLVSGILQAAGDLDVDAPVTRCLPEMATTAYQGATLRHLLDMRTGIDLDERQLRAYAVATNWDPLREGETTQGLSAFFQSLKSPHKPHGGPFKYVSANTDLLGWAIERATGKGFAALVSDLLWKPMGAEDAGYITLDREGLPRCSGGLCMTVRDLARIGQLMLMGGRRDGRQVIPSSWLDDIAGNGDRTAWKQGEFAAGFGGRDMSYRSGWYVINDAQQTLFAMGIHGQNLFVDRANRLVIAKLSSQHSPIDPGAMALTHRAVAEIRRCLIGQ